MSDERHGGERREGGLASAITEAMIRLHRAHFGRGPGNVRTVIAEDVVVCILSDVFTAPERTLLNSGKESVVRDTRLTHQRAAKHEYTEMVERLTGAAVTAFASSITFDPDLAIEVFLLAE